MTEKHDIIVTPAPAFQAAQPIWPEGREMERNLLVEFRAGFDRPEPGPVVLRLTGAWSCVVPPSLAALNNSIRPLKVEVPVDS
jgi:hypothetical protein